MHREILEGSKDLLQLGTATLAMALLIVGPMVLFGSPAYSTEHWAALKGALVPPCASLTFGLLGLVRYHWLAQKTLRASRRPHQVAIQP